MIETLGELGRLVKAHREGKGWTQKALAKASAAPTNRSAVAHLEQGRRIPPPEVLIALMGALGVSEALWGPFATPHAGLRLDFEGCLGELVGRQVSARGLSPQGIEACQGRLERLFDDQLDGGQRFETLGGILVFYGLPGVSRPFFDRYLSGGAFADTDALMEAIRGYQMEAMRLFASLEEAFTQMNAPGALPDLLAPLAPRDLAPYMARAPWLAIQPIPEARLPDLGYISERRLRQEMTERKVISRLLLDLAADLDAQGPAALQALSPGKLRQMDSLLRTFESALRHTPISPLFVPDPAALRREAHRLAPEGEGELGRIALTQSTALENLSHYLTADHLDVYVATSMRTEGDFISVGRFTEALFAHDAVAPLNLRYFNPTQSWIEDRVAKGLVEALMLRRASCALYMAQKADSFGKDSEASVALGQGKPVIVYVPKLAVPEVEIDSEALGSLGREGLTQIIKKEGVGDEAEVDDTQDDVGLMGQALGVRLAQATDDAIAGAVLRAWADFGLMEEGARIEDPGDRARFGAYLSAVRASGAAEPIPRGLRGGISAMLVAGAVNFHRRASLFKEIHPLALQVILSSGVLNGILVARSVEACAQLLRGVMENTWSLRLEVDAHNYRLIEEKTGSTVRVISRNQLISNAFGAFYRRGA